ncbi:MAG TPA: hypothetical protein ENJ20_00220, partial [Bacteroidetes bacterium]|nr:hypothetical protein [Bacteroidota bacterium]
RLPEVESGSNHSALELSSVKPFRVGVPMAAPLFYNSTQFKSLSSLPVPVRGQSALRVYISDKTGTAYLIKGNYEGGEGKSIEQNITDYMQAVLPYLRLNNAAEELFFLKKEKEAQMGFEHWHFRQMWKGVPVYGAELKIHVKDGDIFMLNGRTYPTPKIASTEPSVSKDMAEAIVMEAVAQKSPVTDWTPFYQKYIAPRQVSSVLVIYHLNNEENAERLAWHITAVPNAAHRFAFFVDANTGEILNQYSEICGLYFNKNNLEKNTTATSGTTLRPCEGKVAPENVLLDGPAVADAVDLFGITRTIHTYNVGNDFFLIDASRTMFNLAQSDMPDDPVGAIWTIDGQNGSPENNNFQAAHLASANNTWANPTAVSAHYNGGLAYDYFKNKFGRESINGQGGTIISLINIVENNGQQMDNAFWNGAAMFYGNGNVAFDQPLAKSADVAGHEMSHGVIQSTANLEYMGESGALNESFADVFGAMIDPDRDWQIGEDITNTSIFPTGALRDLQNPHNGGSGLSDNGYQPAHYDERYTGTQDNGGVHINSGIPNKAFQLFADAVGKDRAEQVWYRALTRYLFRSAQFVDCRIAVEQAAADLYGTTEVDAARAAFSAVGIGAGSGTNSQTDIGTNPGDEFVLMTDAGYNSLYIYTPDGVEIANPLSNVPPLSRPSVTDDGSSIVYIATDNTMRAINIDWQANTVEALTIQSDPIWRNVAVSKDGRHLAALTTDNDNRLWIYDFDLAAWQDFELYNPTTGQGGPTTGDVRYADVLQWDFTGEWVMYDALNTISTTGSDIEYWDISFIRVWDNHTQHFGPGNVEKLFNGLPEGISVGNPAFSKNSDYIIAFDYIDGFNNAYSLRAANLEENEVGTIFNNTGLSWPDYSTDDTHIVFDAEDTGGNPVLAFAPLADDKISPQGDAFVFLNDKRWGVWFANGQRLLTSTQEPFAERKAILFPNPVGNVLTLQWASPKTGRGTLEIFDFFGKKIKSESFSLSSEAWQYKADVSGLPAGPYYVRALLGGSWEAYKIIKLQ